MDASEVYRGNLIWDDHGGFELQPDTPLNPLLAPWREGAEAELLFPRARFVVGARALERAYHPHIRDRASFVPGLVRLLEASGRLEVVSGGRSELIGEAYSFRESDGHTPGMLHTLVRGGHQALIYCADLVPGTPWVHLPVTMGYDRFPERLVDAKREIFDDGEGDIQTKGDNWIGFANSHHSSNGRSNPRQPLQVGERTPLWYQLRSEDWQVI